MKTTKIIFTAAAFAILSLVSFSASGKQNEESIYPSTFSRTAKMSSFEIPFTVVHNHFVIVEASINGERLNLLLDEGALETTIDRKKAEKLGLAQAQSITIGSKTFNDSPVIAEFDSVRNSGLNIDGIVGSSIFDNYDVEYDMVNGLIICRPF
jgi:hypothetical protein